MKLNEHDERLFKMRSNHDRYLQLRLQLKIVAKYVIGTSFRARGKYVGQIIRKILVIQPNFESLIKDILYDMYPNLLEALAFYMPRALWAVESLEYPGSILKYSIDPRHKELIYTQTPDKKALKQFHKGVLMVGIFQKSLIITGECNQSVPYAFTSSVGNNLNALFARQLAARVELNPRKVKSFLHYDKNIYLPALKQMILRRKEQNLWNYDIDKWLSTLTAPKRKEMRMALARYVKSGKHPSTFETMPKIEKTNNYIVGTELDILYGKVPFEVKNVRAIMYQSPQHRAIMGPFYSVFQRLWEEELNGYCEPCNYTQLCDKLDTMLYDLGGIPDDISVISTDYSKYDMSFTPETLTVDLELYQFGLENMTFLPYRDDEYDINILTEMGDLSDCQTTECKILSYKMGIQVRLYGCVPSGRNNTTEGNTRRNAEVVCYMAHLAGIDLPIQKYVPSQAKFIVKGDDGIIMMPNELVNTYLTSYSEVYATKTDGGIGFILKICKISTLESMEFLSLEFLLRQGHFRAFRPIQKLLHMNGWSNKLGHNMDHYKARQIMWCEGINYRQCFGDLPIFRVLADHMLKHGIPVSETEWEKLNLDYMHVYKHVEPRNVLSSDVDDFYGYLHRTHAISRSDVARFEKKVANAGCFDIIQDYIYDLAFTRLHHDSYNYDIDSGTLKEMGAEISLPIKATFDYKLMTIRNPEIDVFMQEYHAKLVEINLSPDVGMHILKTGFRNNEGKPVAIEDSY
jgi:hypothetical protein